MKLLLEVLTEFVSMFWADAGLCLGVLAVVTTIGLAHHRGWLGDATSGLALSLGCVLVLLLSVWFGWRRSVRSRRTGAQGGKRA